MGRGSSGAGGGGAKAGGGAAVPTGFMADERAAQEINSVIASAQPNIIGNYLMPDKKKIGKTVDKLLNVGDIVVFGNDAEFQKFQKGWFTVPTPGGGGGSYDIGDIGGIATTRKSLGTLDVKVYRKQ